MIVAMQLPERLHSTLPTDCSVSGLIRRILESAAENPGVLAEAFASRAEFDSPQESMKKYGVYLPEEEADRANKLAAKFLISRNQLIQLLLENVMFRAGLWPPVSDTVIDKDT